jgi:hypothetical protein
MSNAFVDVNLPFGIMALQNDFISRNELIEMEAICLKAMSRPPQDR